MHIILRKIHRRKAFDSPAEIKVINNTILNYSISLAVDMDRPGIKNVIILSNKLLLYDNLIMPSYINITENDILVSSYSLIRKIYNENRMLGDKINKVDKGSL
ncbi:hypothetical protein DRN87_00910 [Candidatus Geothermarchaeota archaeon]|nr:MAG: hypothetical protein DRN87_00910 [Candidatus Geothermarchaeota archaeon]HEW93928.1 hypothetical protein [Thermoprotei archaeon]